MDKNINSPLINKEAAQQIASNNLFKSETQKEIPVTMAFGSEANSYKMKSDGISDFKLNDMKNMNQHQMRDQASNKPRSKSNEQFAQSDNGDGKQEGIMSEPNVKIEISNLEQEKQYLNSKGIKQKPKEIYMNYCKQYVEQHMDYKPIKLDNYRFKKQDIEAYLLSKATVDKIKSLNKQVEDPFDEEALATIFETKSSKSFIDYIFYEDQAFILVKSWQKIIFKDQLSTLQLQMFKSEQYPDTNQQNDGIDQNDDSFYIKTIDVLDKHGKSQNVNGPILVEQVFGHFDNHRVYDTSCIQKQTKLYFFQRKFVPGSTNESVLELKSHQFTECSQQQNALSSEQAEEQSRHLIRIPEQELFASPNQSNLAAEMDILQRTHQQFNITFSQVFGNNPIDKVDDAQEDVNAELLFLTSQYFAIQRYTFSQELKPLKVYGIQDNNEELEIREIIDTTEEKHQSDKCNRQIQYLNHIYTHQQDGQICFIITNMLQQIHLTVDRSGNNGYRQSKIEVFESYQSDNYQRIWNQCGIIPQVAQILCKNKKNQEKQIKNQFYFIDSYTKIQLLYPNYESNIERMKTIEQVQETQRIQQQTTVDLKKIVYMSINKKVGQQQQQNMQLMSTAMHNHIECNFKIVLRELLSLKQILNNKSFNLNQCFTFINDQESQVLFISEPKMNEILRYELQNSIVHNCKFHQDQSTIEIQQQLTKNISGLMSQKLKLNQQQFSSNSQSLKTQLISVECYHHDLHCRNMDSIQSQTEIYEDHHPSIFNRFKKVELAREEYLSHAYIDNFNEKGSKRKIQLYDQSLNQQKIKLITYQFSKDQSKILFLFRLYNQRNPGKQDIQEKLIKRNYFLVSKTKAQLEEILNDQKQEKFVINNDDKVLLVKDLTQFEMVTLEQIYDFQFEEQANFQSKSKNKTYKLKQKKANSDSQYKDTHITLQKQIQNQAESMDFFVFIYQEKSNKDKNALVVIDITDLKKVPKYYFINPSPKGSDFIFEDKQGYNRFLIARTSEIDQPIQRARYQVFTIYTEKIGLFLGEEFLVQKDEQGVRAHTIGQKQVFFSNQVIFQTDWNYIIDSELLPLYIKDSQIQPLNNSTSTTKFKEQRGLLSGCYLIIRLSKSTSDIQKTIPLIDSSCGSQFNYKSQIVLSGRQTFYLSEKEPNFYAIIVSSLLRVQIIQKTIENSKLGLFDRSQAFTILQMAQHIQLQMRQPDLEFMIISTFEKLLREEFHQAQEILQGKSLCDICLTDSEIIQNTLMNAQDTKISKVQGTLIEQIIDGDGLRKETFKMTDFYPQQSIIHIDFNFMSTIERAIKFNSYKSLKIVLEEILEGKIQSFYQQILMYDMPLIMQCNQVQINDFFQLNRQELGQTCKLEIPFESADLPPFHNTRENHDIIEKFDKFLNIQDEIIKQIKSKDKDKQDNSKKEFEIEYSYIDFHMQIIGEKIRCFKEDQSQIKFDNLYYSQILKRKSDNKKNDKLFLQRSIQKLIDSQWIQTFKVNRVFFLVYFVVFLIPMCIVSFKIADNEQDDQALKNLMFGIASVPALILCLIDAIQIMKQGWEYFHGWNLSNLAQLLVFIYIIIIKYFDLDNETYRYAQVRLLNITLAFFKLLYFIRIFEDYGFLVQMVVYCVHDLIPFLVAYILFHILFSMCYMLLQLEIDDEVAEGAQQVDYFYQLLIETFRNAIGELALPKYDKIYEQETSTAVGGFQKEASWFLYINVLLIWVVFFIQTFFLNIIILNFMIAVIMQTYEKVTNGNLQVIIRYKHKAALNHQRLILQSVFRFFKCCQLREYRCIVFSSTVDEMRDSYDQFIEHFNSMKRHITEQHQELIKINTETERVLNRIHKNQDTIEKSVKDHNHKIQNLQQEIRNQYYEVKNKKDDLIM